MVVISIFNNSLIISSLEDKDQERNIKNWKIKNSVNCKNKK